MSDQPPQDWQQAHADLKQAHADVHAKIDRHRRHFWYFVAFCAFLAIWGAIRLTEAFHQAFTLQ